MLSHRYRRARERAGLTLGQAARLLGWTVVDLSAIETSPSRTHADTERKLADRYGVNVEWLSGEKDRCDYESIKDVRGYDELSFHDREVVAEFAASLPANTTRICEHCGIRFVVAQDDVDTTMCKNHRRSP